MPAAVNGLKECSKCGEVKEVGEFYKDKSNKGGLRSSCKACSKACDEKYRKENPEKIKTKNAKYRKELGNCYLRKLIESSIGISRQQIPQELIELKRLQLGTDRRIKSITKTQENG